MSNTGTVKITLKIDGKGNVRVLEDVGKASSSTGKKGKKAFKDMDKSAKSFNQSAKMTASTLLKMGAGVVGIIGLAKAWGSLKSAAKEYIALASEQEDAERKLGSVLKATGEAAGFNLDQLKAMASGLQEVTRYGDEATMAGMAILATFKQVGSEAFERATLAAMDMSTVMKTDLKSSILQIGKALNDPAKGLTALSRAGVTFTKSQEDTIKTLQKSGQMMEAQSLILKELESQFGGSAKDAVKDFEGKMIQAKNALGDTKEEMGFIITKNQVFIELIHKATEKFVSWGTEIKNNRDHLMDLAKNGVMLVVKSLKAAWEATTMLWDLLSSIPKGVLDFFTNLADETKRAAEETNKLNKAIDEIQLPDQTTFQRFWNFMGEWGRNIIEVFAFMGKSVGSVFAVMLSDALEVVKLIGEQFLSLGKIIWDVLSFDFDGAKKGYAGLENVSDKFLKNIKINWAAYETSINDGWSEMIADMMGDTEKAITKLSAGDEIQAALIESAKGQTAALKKADDEQQKNNQKRLKEIQELYQADVDIWEQENLKKYEISIAANAKRKEDEKNAHKLRLEQIEKELETLQDANQKKYALTIAATKEVKEDTWMLEKEHLANKKKSYEDHIEWQTQYEYDEEKKRNEKAEKAYEDSLKEQARAHEQFVEGIQDDTEDILYKLFSSPKTFWADALDEMTDYLYKSLAKWAAMAIAEPIIVPVIQNIGGSMTSALGFGKSGGGGFNIPGLNSLGNLFGGGLPSGSFALAPGVPGSMAVAGNTAYAAGIGNAGTIGGGGWGGASSIGAGSAGIMSSVAMAGFGAIAGIIIGKVFSSMAEKHPAMAFMGSDKDYWKMTGLPNIDEAPFDTAVQANGIKSKNFDYKIATKDFGTDSIKVQDTMFQYFDTVFTELDAVTTTSINDVLKDFKFYGKNAGIGGGDFEGSFKQLSKDVFSDFVGTILTDILPNVGIIDKTFNVITGSKVQDYIAIPQAPLTGIDAFDNINNSPSEAPGSPGGPNVLPQINVPIYSDITRQVSAMADVFNTAFFDAITPEGGNEWDSFIRFADVVQEADDFMADFTNRTQVLGETVLEAFLKIETTAAILTGMEDAVDTLVKSSSISAFDQLKTEWDALIKILKEANATTKQLTEAEAAKNEVLGAQLTGMSANSLQSVIMGNGTLQSVMKASFYGQVSGTVAQDLYDQYLKPLNEGIYKAFGKDQNYQAAYDYVAGIDLSPLKTQIKYVQDFFDGIVETVSKAELAKIKNYQAYDVAKNVLVASIEKKISDLQVQEATLQKNLADAKAAYIAALDEEISKQEDVKAAAQQAAEEFKSLAETLAQAQTGALTQGALSNQGKADFAKIEFENAMKLSFQGDKQAMAKLPGLASSYIDLSKKAMTDKSAWQNLVTSVYKQLGTAKGIALTQAGAQEKLVTQADTQIAALNAQKDAVTGVSSVLLSVAAAQKIYTDAQTALTNSTITTAIGNLQIKLGNLTNTTPITPIDVPTAEDNFKKAGEAIFNPADYGASVTDAMLAIQTDPAAVKKFISDQANVSVADVTAFYNSQAGTAFTEAQAKQYLGFDSGGTLMGSASGYQLPVNPTFHGVEHITPDSQMQGVKDLLAEIKDIMDMSLNVSADHKDKLDDLLDYYDAMANGNKPFKTEAA